MSKNCRLFIFWLILIRILVPVASNAQFIGYKIDNDLNKTSFGFKFINNLIIVPVIMNDSIEMQFILDTGVRTTLLTDIGATPLDVAENRQVKIAGLGQDGEIQAYVASNVQLQLPGITGKGQTLIVLEEGFLDLKSHIGQAVHGILGYDFFNHFVVKIDYISNKITVYEPAAFSPPEKYTSIPIKVLGGRPYLPVSIIQSNDSEITGTYLIDTGASHSILLDPDANDGINLPQRTIPTVVGWGLSGQIDGKMGRVKFIRFGNFEFKNALASFGHCVQANPQLVPDRIGSVGGELLSRFSVIFNYAEEKIYIRKNFRYKGGFEHNKSGLELVVDGYNYNTFKVLHVMEQSPASEAGILPDDIVVAINGKGAGQLSLEEIQGIFRAENNQNVQLIVLRDNRYLSFNFRLRRLI